MAGDSALETAGSMQTKLQAPTAQASQPAVACYGRHKDHCTCVCLLSLAAVHSAAAHAGTHAMWTLQRTVCPDCTNSSQTVAL
jgi:hypothetical protein